MTILRIWIACSMLLLTGCSAEFQQRFAAAQQMGQAYWASGIPLQEAIDHALDAIIVTCTTRSHGGTVTSRCSAY